MGMIGYLKGFLDQQRADPKTELMAGILAGQVEDRPVNDAEILGMLALLYIGGLDTVHSALGWFVRHLASDPALQQRLRQNPDDIPRAIEELMRAYGITATHRRIAKDFTFHGVEMRAGEMVLLPAPLASRDPRAYDNPHVVDIDRNARHIFFGFGAHHCLGQHLARREIKIVFESFLERFDNIRIPAGAEVKHHTGSTWGLDRLPLAWERR
jgi:cytochrome P450